MITKELVIIGGGPAGMSAAVAAYEFIISAGLTSEGALNKLFIWLLCIRISGVFLHFGRT